MKPVSIKILIIACLSALLAGCGGQRHAAKIEPPEDDRVPAITVATPKRGIDPQVAKALEREARSWLGVKYIYGGETRKGTDCSGLVMSVFRDVAGVKLPRSSAEQQKFCKRIDRKRMAKGDLVFFSSGKNGRVSHVGLYIGNGDFIHSSSSRGVMISNLDEKYYVSHFHSAGRVPTLAETVVTPDIPDNIPANDRAKERDDIYMTRGQSRKGNTDNSPKKKSDKTPVPKPSTAPQAEVVEIPLDSLAGTPPRGEDIRNKVKNAF